METGDIKRKATDSYLRQIWEEEIEAKINKKVMQGKSILKVKAFYSYHSSSMLVKVGRKYGYNVELTPSHYFTKWRILIKW